MKVFLSWSGERSKAAAQALKEWLPLCIQSLEPWISTADIDKGARWSEEVAAALESADGRGIFCLTPENLNSPWLNFEAGVVAARGGNARVWTLVLGMKPIDVKPPLGLYQNTTSDKAEMLKLMQSLNLASPKPLEARVLERAFEMNWPELDRMLSEAMELAAPVAPVPTVQGRLDELLTASRRVEMQLDSQATSLRMLTRSVQGLSEPVAGLGLALGQNLGGHGTIKWLKTSGSTSTPVKFLSETEPPSTGADASVGGGPPASSEDSAS